MKHPVSRPSITEIERDLVAQALSRVQLSQGEWVARFEQLLAEFLSSGHPSGPRGHVVCTTSGTTALHLALVAAGIGPGDEVIVPDLTFVATANAVRYTGAEVVVVDIDRHTWGLNYALVDAKRSLRTRAIVPVHLYGVACAGHDGWPHHDLVIEDAAEGFGGSLGSHMLGTLGHMGVFSFYGNKVITCGEGGAVWTEDADLAKRLRFLRGQALDPNRRYYHPEIGFNYRLTDLQAAVGVGQMTRVEAMLEQRRKIFSLYRHRLCYDVGVTQVDPPGSRSAPWVFTLQLHERIPYDRVVSRLTACGVETRPGFVPLHQLPMYRRPDSEFPVATALAPRILSLPTHADMTLDDVNDICNELIAAVEAC
jgi:perosamine synthetase